MQIKIFTADSAFDLEEEVNPWLEEKSQSVRDDQLRLHYCVAITPDTQEFSVLIEYPC